MHWAHSCHYCHSCNDFLVALRCLIAGGFCTSSPRDTTPLSLLHSPSLRWHSRMLASSVLRPLAILRPSLLSTLAHSVGTAESLLSISPVASQRSVPMCQYAHCADLIRARMRVDPTREVLHLRKAGHKHASDQCKQHSRIESDAKHNQIASNFRRNGKNAPFKT